MLAVHWVRCDKRLFGFAEDLMLGDVYINPVSQHFPAQAITNSYSSLLYEVAHVTEVSPHVLLCCDFNAKIGALSETTDIHGGLLVAHPALHQAVDVNSRMWMPLADN
jgi:hypothetical protein